ncbi:hypothetical protein CUC00_12225 [Prevotella intermedia]|uniref:hypothetical protein n=1 Tax=Prevotella intermedia TaxID=28131 RepID=UPI000C1C3969|nr:hypothetical protein [Prevotella intermedia]ATV34374.1 hypothetical protein CTM44_11360 [Prevotella intermedia]ATV41831.1 hypothetical protein CUC00_12225 [Prevotella intermedia]
MKDNLSRTSNAPLSFADELRQKAKDKSFWINAGCLFFLLLYALKPIIGSSDMYWWVVSALEVMGFAVLLASIIAGFKRKLRVQSSSKSFGKTIYAYLFICFLGITVNYIYLSTVSLFWVSMTLLAFALMFLEKPRKRR